MRYFSILILFMLSLTGCVPEGESVESVQAIPTDAIAIFRVNDSKDFASDLAESMLWQKIDSSATVLKLKGEIDFYKKNILAGHSIEFPFFISAHRSGAGSYDLLLSAHQMDIEKSLGAEKSILQNLPAPKIRTYDGVEIRTYNTDEKSFSTALIQDVFLLSTSNLLVEKSIRQIKAGLSLMDNPLFDEIYNSANTKDPANLWIQYMYLDEFLDGRVEDIKSDWSERLAHWTELDITIREKGFLFSGVSSFSDSVPSIIGMLAGNPAQELSVTEFMPANTAAFVALGFENHATLQREYKKYLKFYNLENNLEKALENKTLTEGFYGWIDNQMAVFVTEAPDGNPEQQTYAAIKFRDRELAAERLRNVSDVTVEENYEGYVLSQINANAMSVYYGELFHYLRQPYYTTIRDYIVFAQSKSALRVLINDFKFGRTLKSKSHYTELASSFSSRSNALIYFDLSKSISSFDRIIGEKLEAEISGAEQLLSGLGYLMIQVETKDDFAYTHAILQTVEEKSADATTYWTVQLDTAIEFGPVPVANHMTDQKELLVQDVNHSLYLISTDGRILWKKPLDGPILGSVHQIDAYKNNKLQYIFNTENKVYFVDRNGNDVSAFPITLKKSATAPMNVLDYDGNRNYRLLVPCGNALLNYDIDGVEVSGWKYKKESGNIVAMPQLFQIGNMDFIFIRHDGNRVRALNRKGENRLTFDPEIELSDNPLYLIPGNNVENSRVVVTSTDGQLVSFFLGGNSDVTAFESLNSDHGFGYYNQHFTIADQNYFAVKGPEYTYVNEELKDPFAPKDFRFSDHLRFGVTDRYDNTFWLFEPNGEASAGFPVRGNLPGYITDLERNGKLKVITGEMDGFVHVYSLEW